MQPQSTEEEASLWDRRKVCEFFGGTKPMNYSTVWRGIKDGRIPKPIRPSPGTVRWLPSECRAALAAMIAEQRGAA
jgi:predicted DNA-binding transcriptional regulator AlpA